MTCGITYGNILEDSRTTPPQEKTMAHAIESQNAVFTGSVAWHRIGTEIAGGTFAEQLTAAQDAMPVLFSSYSEHDAFIVLGSDTRQVPDVKAIVRDADAKIMRHTVGADTFCLRQPADIWERAKAFAECVPSARLSFAAYLNGGSRLFVCLDLGDVQIAGEAHRRYLTLATGFDGSYREEVILSVVRSVCANTVAFARADAGGEDAEEDCKGAWRTLHTKYAAERIQKADLRFADILDRFGLVAKRLGLLTGVKVSKPQARELVSDVLERSGHVKDTTKGRAKSMVDEILAVYEDSAIEDQQPWRGTAYGVHQAVTRYFTHLSWIPKVRNGGQLEGDVGTRVTEYSFGTGADYIRASQAAMDDLLRARGVIELEDAGVHLGERVGTSGELAAVAMAV